MSRFYSPRRLVGSVYWPHTRIRKRGLVATQNLKMRTFFKSAAVYVAIFFVFCLGYVWTRVQVIETGYRLRRFEETLERAKEINRSLMVEAATLRSPQRLEAASVELELKRPTEQQRIYYLRKNVAKGE